MSSELAQTWKFEPNAILNSIGSWGPTGFQVRFFYHYGNEGQTNLGHLNQAEVSLKRPV
jgi:hypothetical protein